LPISPISRPSIEEQLQDGSYFKEAKSWYAHMFLEPYSQKVYQLLATIIIILATYILIEVANTDYMQTKVPFAIYFDEKLDFVSRIKPITQGNESINTSYARYFLKHYVELYERYDLEWEQDTYRLKALSSLRIYDNYLRFMDPNLNPESPVLRYKGHTTRNIEIVDVILSDQAIHDKGIVIFKAIEENNGQQQEGKNFSLWQAEVEFAMTDFNKVIKDELAPRFIVTKYHVNKLS
jgi:type IV secretory pathway component VirB8